MNFKSRTITGTYFRMIKGTFFKRNKFINSKENEKTFKVAEIIKIFENNFKKCSLEEKKTEVKVENNSFVKNLILFFENISKR